MKKKSQEYTLAKIKVMGVGGAGNNAVTRMYGNLPRGVELIAINTDVQDLNYTQAKKKIHIGKNITRGLGTGMNPDLGRRSAEENRSEIAEVIRGADMVFITAGFGGGTGSGAAPVVAEISREMGILTVAVVTRPFGFEGAKRRQIADEAMVKLRDRVDAMIVIPNDRIFSLIDKDTSLLKAFEAIDEVLKNAVQGITELIIAPGIVNVDFADVKAIMQDSGSAIIGVGFAAGPERAINAVNMAVKSPLLENSIEGARGVLFSVSGHRDLKMNEINEAAKLIAENVDTGAKIIFGTYHDRKLKKGQIKVTLIATGFNGNFNKSNLLLPGLFERREEGMKEGGVNFERPPYLADKSAVNDALVKKAESVPPKEPTLFDGKTETKARPSPKTDEDVWEIPAFLRKKKKKSR